MSKVLLPDDVATELLNSVLSNLVPWAMKSAATFRRAVCNDGGLAINPLIQSTDDTADVVLELLRSTIESGCMIDFGHVPNDVLKATAIASREAFEAGELLQPFDDWIGVMSWEGGFNAYYVLQNPFEPNSIRVTEFYGVDPPGIGPLLVLYDVVTIAVEGPGKVWLNPIDFQYPDLDPVMANLSRSSRAANSLDPLVTMLRLLADASIPVERVETPEKVNRGRARAGKPPLPPHTVVRTKDYVTRCIAHATGRRRGEAQGGTHASPISHWRRAHQRHLPGRVVPVRSSRVNWRDVTELRRMFYRVK